MKVIVVTPECFLRSVGRSASINIVLNDKRPRPIGDGKPDFLQMICLRKM